MRLTLGTTMVQVMRNLATASWYAVAAGAPVYAGLSGLAALTSWSSPLPQLGAPVRVEDHRLDSVTGHLPVEALPTAAALTCIGLWLVAALAWLPVIGRFRGFMASVVADGPFVPQNVSRLGNLGTTLIVAPLLSGAAISLMSLVAVTVDSPSEPALLFVGLRLQLGWLLLGFVIVALAEIFRVGADLQTDHELTI